jgi:hypothetical protein
VSDIDQARADLVGAVTRWLIIKASEDDEATDQMTVTNTAYPLGFIVVAAFTSVELELAGASATAYFAPDGQIAPLSRGLAMGGVDRWANI